MCYAISSQVEAVLLASKCSKQASHLNCSWFSTGLLPSFLNKYIHAHVVMKKVIFKLLCIDNAPFLRQCICSSCGTWHVFYEHLIQDDQMTLYSYMMALYSYQVIFYNYGTHV